MRKILHQHTISFMHAWEGIRWALTTQPNFRVHISFAILALIFGFYFQISYVEMSLIVFAIVLGLTAEMINTALEAMTDLITSEWKKEAKIAKDVSAGMMLLSAIGTVIVAIFIFGPRLMG